MWRRLVLALFLLASPSFLAAEELTSANFRILDPVLQSAGYGSGGGRQMFGTLTEPGLGTSTAAGFGLNPGFLHFPTVTRPTLAATAGDGEASLVWTAAQGFLGWSVSGYDVGQAAGSGGPYSFEAVGDVLSATADSLTNGVTYYFVVRVKDAFGSPIATSSEVSATPRAVDTSAAGRGGFSSLSGLRRFFPPGEPLGLRPCLPAADLNCDGKVDLRDLSVFLFLTSRSMPNPADFNDDQEIDARDLSILFSAWTKRFLAFEFGAAEKRPEEPVSLLERLRPFSGAAVSVIPRTDREASAQPAVGARPDILLRLTGFVAGLFRKIADFFRGLFVLYWKE